MKKKISVFNVVAIYRYKYAECFCFVEVKVKGQGHVSLMTSGGFNYDIVIL